MTPSGKWGNCERTCGKVFLLLGATTVKPDTLGVLKYIKFLVLCIIREAAAAQTGGDFQCRGEDPELVNRMLTSSFSWEDFLLQQSKSAEQQMGSPVKPEWEEW